MKRRFCRRCRVQLTVRNARMWKGRFVGACRECESIEAGERKKARSTATRRS